MKAAFETIYFLTSPLLAKDDLLMRIGYSSVADSRLATHEKTIGTDCLIACMPGTYDQEQRLHRHFQGLGLLSSRLGTSSSWYEGTKPWKYLERLLIHAYATHQLADLEHMHQLPNDVIDPEFLAAMPTEDSGQLSMVELDVRVRVARAAKLVKYSSSTDEWYTPEPLIESARTVLGDIDLDPASCPPANRLVKATQIWSAARSGLAKQHRWSGRVWMNPPFGGKAQKFARRLLAEYQAGTVTEAIALFSSMATVCRWFQPIYAVSSAIMLSCGRPKFRPGSDKQIAGKTNSPGSGVVICYFGPNTDRFVDEFSRHGQCLRPIGPKLSAGVSSVVPGQLRLVGA